MNEFFNSGLGKTLIIIGIVFLATLTLGQLQGLRYIGAGVPATNTIAVSGYGEAFGAADIATFSFSVVSEKPTVVAAQADATAKINAIIDYLKSAGIDQKDIQTTDYSVSPQYDYVTQACPQGVYCPGGKQVLRGYQVSQSTSVKVRDTSKAGDLLAGVGTKGATNVSGLNFTFDDPNKLQGDARGKAIADAKQKADALAKQLGVTLVRVVSFSENGTTPGPIYYAKDMAVGMGGSAPAAPEISVGQNKVTSNVSVTYEIR
jgi:uncharacterized protein YggE